MKISLGLWILLNVVFFTEMWVQKIMAEKVKEFKAKARNIIFI